MKRVSITLLAVVVLFVAFILLYRWDSGRNHGFTFGYYGEFNTVSNALASLPGVTILNSGYNADVTLEEFGFDIRTSEGRDLHVWLMEEDPIRRMSKQKLTKALSDRIAKELSNKSVE
jgi:hypothetical protein